MGGSPETHDRDGIGPDEPGGPSGGDSDPGVPAMTKRNSGWGRERLVLEIATLLLLVGSGIAGWRWFRWTRSDDYQFQRVDAEGSALAHDLEGMDITDRWIALTALTRDTAEAKIRAAQISNPYYRLQTLSLLTATLAKAGAAGDAEVAGRQFSEIARVVADSSSAVDDPERKVRFLEPIAMAMARAGLTEPARSVARQTSDEANRIPDALARSSTLSSLARKFAEWRNFDLSRSIVLKIEVPGLRSSAMIELAAILARAGQLDQAKVVALQGLEAAARIPGADARTAAQFEAAPVLARIGLADEARDTACGSSIRRRDGQPCIPSR